MVLIIDGELSCLYQFIQIHRVSGDHALGTCDFKGFINGKIFHRFLASVITLGYSSSEVQFLDSETVRLGTIANPSLVALLPSWHGVDWTERLAWYISKVNQLLFSGPRAEIVPKYAQSIRPNQGIKAFSRSKVSQITNSDGNSAVEWTLSSPWSNQFLSSPNLIDWTLKVSLD